MDLLVAWLLFPALLLILCGGCGLLVERLGGRELRPALLPLAGFAAIVVVGQFTVLADATAELTAPAVVALAIAGVALGRRRLRALAADGGGFAAAAAVFAVYAAPIVLTGEPTIAGFIKLDDTATWLALTDRVMDHGRDLGGLAPSTYEATLHFNLGDGYPIGVFVPFGVGAALSGAEPAWTIQPYIAFGAALLALALWSLATPLARSPGLRAAAAFVGAQPALLFGYYLWGGVKEVVAAMLVAGFVALAAPAAGERGRPAAVAAIVVAAALVGALGVGALAWIVPAAGALALLVERRGAGSAAARRAVGFAACLALLALPVIVSGALLPPTTSPLTDGDARGNLVAALDPAQAAGIWPAGDFRFHPDAELAAYALIAVACGTAIAGLLWCRRRGEPAPVVYVLAALTGCAALVLVGSPWVGGKALAIASPAIPFAAMLGVGWLATVGRRLTATAVGALVGGAVLWSNALGYGGASLAPHDQLAELERIGERIGGQGPTLITEYEPYAARHFLRDADPEAISELRRRPVPLRDGSVAEKGDSADTDRIDPAALASYRTLVVRRSPVQSRPPSPYRLIWRGDSYEAWQRPAGAATISQRIPLGDRYDPYGVPACGRVRALARSGDLLAAAGDPPFVVEPAADAPADAPKAITAEVRVRRRAAYDVWLGGSLRSAAELLVDGVPAGEVRHQLNNEGGYVRLGSVGLEPGVHQVEVRLGGPDLHPGSAGATGELGPLALSSTDPDETRLVSVPAADARRLCGREWDWIEAAG